MTVHVGEMNWRQYRDNLREGRTPLFLPLGALEQHGPHMSMNVDVLLPTKMSETVAERVGGMVAPPLTYGYKSQVKSGGGNHFPGTTSLDGHTLSCLVRDLILEFARHGARKIVAVNGHFENTVFLAEGAELALRALRAQGVHDLRIMTLSYWDFLDEAAITRLYPQGFGGWDIEHGGLLETSMMLHWYPHLVDMSKVERHPPAIFPPYDLHPLNPDWTPSSGTLSSPENASGEKGRLIVEVSSANIVSAVQGEFGE